MKEAWKETLCRLRTALWQRLPEARDDPYEDDPVPAVTRRDKAVRFLNDPARARFFLLLAVLCTGISFWTFRTAERTEQDALRIAGENRRIRAVLREPPPQDSAVLKELFAPADRALWQSCAEEAGMTVISAEEESAGGDEWGENRKIIVKARGTYAQIVETFDIINGKERWSAAYPAEIRREGDHLTAAVGIRTFLMR